MSKFLEKRIKTAKDLRKEVINPFIAFIGDYSKDGTEEVEVFIIVFGSWYTIESGKLLDAVDFLYKILITLRIDFPVECRHIWVFLHKYFYKIKVAGPDWKYQKVTTALNDIANVKLTNTEPVIQDEDLPADGGDSLVNLHEDEEGALNSTV